ncbi:NAD-dependent succinate-semialdehyde dehydrogenase [Exiguobacterium flavidum]|uniref:NAD-dependent succinate-semialdehyde dehydrogenase n=1 Tax=Exiguobacterium flavidum TaxID=2184695 RepID=UPI000DF8529E|nr:NAD-dependent succinate-semialdehyde dehydrogenase [Exiguobacterium flavidum]
MEGKFLIGGEWTTNGRETVDVKDPATGEVVGKIPKGAKEDVNAAVAAARKAFPDWSKRSVYERSALLEKLYVRILEEQEALAELMTREMGKPLAESKGEVQYAANFVKWFAEEGKRAYGRIIPTHDAGKRLHVIRQPVGVVAAITPWNFPAAMITRKLAPALVAGCTFVLKPPTETPLTALRLLELCQEVGIPDGVVNAVTGSGKELGEVLATHPHVNKITFTGSTGVGRTLMAQGAETIKSMSLELGGHAPILVFDDCDLDLAVAETIKSKFRNGGQTCVCGNRIYVSDSIYDAFVDKLGKETAKLKVGNGFDEATKIGPMINEAGYEKVDKHVTDATSAGARLVTGGKGTTEGGTYFYEPTVIADVSPGMLIMNEETFGPVAPVQRVSSDEEAVHYANQTPFGLASYVFTRDYARAMHAIEKLDYGIVGWNDGLPSAAQAPFGGMKQSGVGREGGIEGLDAYLETKYISIGGL